MLRGLYANDEPRKGLVWRNIDQNRRQRGERILYQDPWLTSVGEETDAQSIAAFYPTHGPKVLAWSGPLYVSGFYTTSRISADLRNWTTGTMPAPGDNSFNFYWNTIFYSDGKFIALGNGTVSATSVDGLSWSSVLMPVSVGTSWARSDSGTLVALSLSNGQFLYSTNNGGSWTNVAVVAEPWLNVLWGGGVFCAFSDSASSFYLWSVDGISWTQRSYQNQVKHTFIHDGNRFIGTGNGDTYWNGTLQQYTNVSSIVSYDGVTWKTYYPADHELDYPWAGAPSRIAQRQGYINAPVLTRLGDSYERWERDPRVVPKELVHYE